MKKVGRLSPNVVQCLISSMHGHNTKSGRNVNSIMHNNREKKRAFGENMSAVKNDLTQVR